MFLGKLRTYQGVSSKIAIYSLKRLKYQYVIHQMKDAIFDAVGLHAYSPKGM